MTLHQSGSGSSQGSHHPSSSFSSSLKRNRLHLTLLQCAPVSFSEAVVGLAVELIVLTHAAVPQTRLRSVDQGHHLLTHHSSQYITLPVYTCVYLFNVSCITLQVSFVRPALPQDHQGTRGATHVKDCPACLYTARTQRWVWSLGVVTCLRVELSPGCSHLFTCRALIIIIYCI